MSKKIVFMGTPSYATTILEALLEKEFEIVALFTQSDKKVGRKQEIKAPHIKQFCLDNSLNIPIYQPNRLRDNEKITQNIKALNPDFIVVAAYGQILPKEILDIAPCINLHASLLPKYRGASPIQESLLNNDKYTGVTAMLMEEGLDTGDILGFKYLKNSKTLEVEEAFEKLSNIAACLTIETLNKFDKIAPLKQNNSLSSLCKKIKKDDGKVDFLSAKNLFLKYKAYSYWPGIFLQSGLKLKEIEFIDDSSNNKVGEILAIAEQSVTIGCKEGKLEIKTFQAPSKKELNSVEYLRGKRLTIGDILQ